MTLDGAESRVESNARDYIAARKLALGNIKKGYRAFVLALQKTRVVVRGTKKDFDFKCPGNGVVQLMVKVPVRRGAAPRTGGGFAGGLVARTRSHDQGRTAHP